MEQGPTIRIRLTGLRLLPLFLILLHFIFSPVSAESSQTVDLTPAEQAWLKAHPVIRLAPDPEFRPIEYFDRQEQYAGAAADHIRLLEKKLGIHITIVRLKNWDEVMDKFKRHEVDLLGAVAAAPSRRQYMLFTDTLVAVPGGIFSRVGSPQNITLKDLAGKKVAVVSNYVSHDILRNQYPDIILDVVPDVSTGLSKASLGVVDAYVENMANATYYSQLAGITNLQLAGTTNFDFQWGIGIRKDWPELQVILNKGLAAISPGERQEIINRWIYVQGPERQLSRPLIVVSAVTMVVAILIGFTFWNYSLQRQVRSRTLSLQHELEARQKAETALSILNAVLEERVRDRTAELMQEISERKRVESQLEQLNEELEKRVANRTTQLELANQELESFSYSVSHDLRAPLRHIQAYSSILLEDYADKLDEQAQNYLNRMLNAGKNLTKLIDELLLLSRITRLEINRCSVNMTNLAQDIVSDLVAEEPQREVQVEIEENLSANGDPNQLKTVLENLLGNAWKYTGKKEKAVIKFGSEEMGGRMVYYVRDNGAGFDMVYSDRLFLPFQRLHKQEEFEGTGIGLASVQRIIRRHGGEIWANAEKGNGATFYFSLE